MCYSQKDFEAINLRNIIIRNEVEFENIAVP